MKSTGDRPELGTVPARQGLIADGSPAVEPNDRLVGDVHLAAPDCAAERGPQAKLRRRDLAGAIDSRYHGPRARLAAAHGVAGALEQVGTRLAGGADGQTDCCGHAHTVAVDVEPGIGHGRAQPAGEPDRRALVTHVAAQEREEVAARAPQHVPCTRLSRQPLANLLEHPVGRRRAVGIVDEPEAVKPDADRGDSSLVSWACGLQQLVGLRAEQRVVCEPGETVLQAALGKRPAHLQMGRHRGGQVGEDPHVLLAPFARRSVDRAQRAHGVSVGEHQRYARVGDQPEIADGEIVGPERMHARVGDDQRLPGGDRVLTEGVTQRQLAHAGQLPGRPA